MLVLSRRLNEGIVFPNTGIRVRLVGAKGKAVRLGIEAPPGVAVLREELAPAGQQAPAPSGLLPHALRNRLNLISLGLCRLDLQLQAGQIPEGEATLRQVLRQLESFDREWPAAPAPPKRCRTLVVDDDANERELLAGILNMKGCDCSTAADGLDALRYLASNERPDVVLLDLLMPRFGGRQTLERIRRDPRFDGLKVFAISGTTPQDEGIEVGPAGVDAWFPKPLNPLRLWDAIQTHLPSPSAAN
jgi:carbon storage regulator CsrA